jgi:hypothetical protein
MPMACPGPAAEQHWGPIQRMAAQATDRRTFHSHHSAQGHHVLEAVEPTAAPEYSPHARLIRD